MKLATYLESHAISDAAFGEAIGVSRQAVFRYRTGERRPEWAVLEAIARATGGAVTADDFMDGGGDGPAAPARETTG
jgi:transcriptional regulator with XRE-family HTH domain